MFSFGPRLSWIDRNKKLPVWARVSFSRCLLFPHLFSTRLPSLFAFKLAPTWKMLHPANVSSQFIPSPSTSMPFSSRREHARANMEEDDPSRTNVCCHPAHQIPDPPLTDSEGLEAFSRASQCRRDPPTQTESSSRKPSRHPVGHKRGLPRNTIPVAEM